MNRRWTMTTADAEKTAYLRRALNIHPVICDLLVQRGVETFEEARQFFRPDLAGLHSPWLMKDMKQAVDRIITAMNTREKILVFGDYDVDGTTAVAVVYRFLRKYHEELEFYIPHRYREGYGVSKAGIDFAAEQGYTLIISLDCGIKSVELVRYAKTLGIDFVICDHHLPDEEIPPAVAILNAKQKDCPYPYKELCGCGVGFKLITALGEKLNLDPSVALEDLDLVATAIAADIVPVTGENRILAFHGLKKANESPNNGIRALSQLSGITSTLLINNLVFMIAPRVNAAGRMDDARKAVLMFIAESPAESLKYAEMLHADNTDRKEADSSITEEALELIGANAEWINRSSTVVFKPSWHKGVVGIVASRIIEHYHRPTVVLTQSGDYVAGSARSVPGFNLYEAIHACREHLLGYGGHYAAAGMTLELSQVDAFREKFEAIVSNTISPELLIPEIRVDAEIRLGDITPSFYRILCQMEPFGPGNPKPLFVCRNVADTGWSKIVKEDHLRFSLKQDGTVITGIGFCMADKYSLLALKQPVDIVFKIDENNWNGNTSLQLRVVDVRPST
jgi:single-stranded-DNA-specific exonuclease